MLFTSLLATASVVGSASAFSILSPGGPNLWWVAGSENTLVWTCHDNPPAQTFQLLLNNTSPTVLTSAEAILANLPNADCSQSITTQQVNLAPATGYTLIIADQTDQTKIYAVSDQFEVKAVGSAFPATSATPTGSSSVSATASGSGSAPSASTSTGSGANTSSATGFKTSLAGVFGVAAVAFGML
ncbi:hypothetical protein K488DRAFT_39622 [Vararia minispora EC-137]|uniref:Uncharacterized protein n=1 Tax=Vararia minispora EC-137 TaxID=1314806 RepID=A0ACB8R115_9AGAM|nr:hypothetical protein K488DRAFT_39622 [Vararia minispora EC-137]